MWLYVALFSSDYTNTIFSNSISFSEQFVFVSLIKIVTFSTSILCECKGLLVKIKLNYLSFDIYISCDSIV